MKDKTIAICSECGVPAWSCGRFTWKLMVSEDEVGKHGDHMKQGTWYFASLLDFDEILIWEEEVR